MGKRNRTYAGAGASKKFTIADVPSLGSKWVAQIKVDGVYCVLVTDRHGRIRHVESRAGQALPQALAGHLYGALVAWPNSVLHGELEAMTDRGNRTAEERGIGRLVHLFDCSQADGHSLTEEPYNARRDILHRMQSEIVNMGPERSWTPLEGLRGRDLTSGQFVRTVAEDWRLTPIVESYSLSRASELWDRAVAGELEGLVVVNTEARLGARGSKLKLKPTNTVDGTVVRAERGGFLVYLPGEDRHVTLGPRTSVAARVGDVVEILHEGRYASGELRFARLSRVRQDLTPVIPLRRVG